MSSSAAGCAAVLAYEAPLLIYEGFLSAVGTFYADCSCAVGYILLESTLNAVFPCVDVGGVELQAAYELQQLNSRSSRIPD